MMPRLSRFFRLGPLCLLVVCVFAARLQAQQSASAPAATHDLESDQIFSPPIADPFEPASLIREGSGNLDFGLALPLTVYTSVGHTSGWQIGFLGGIEGRFISLRTTLYLKAADFHAGIPVSFRRGKWSARAEFYHVSSHLGGDYENLTGFQPFHYSREALQALVSYDAPHGLRIYGGPTLLVRTYPHVEPWAFQAGTEWLPKRFSTPRWHFVLADDFQTRGEVYWRTNISITPGVQWTTRQAEPIARLTAWFYNGQVPFGEFYRQREHVVGAQLTFTLEPAIKSLITHRH
jgi:hypothetical protein